MAMTRALNHKRVSRILICACVAQLTDRLTPLTANGVRITVETKKFYNWVAALLFINIYSYIYIESIRQWLTWSINANHKGDAKL